MSDVSVIDKKIVGYKIISKKEEETSSESVKEESFESPYDTLNETIKRPTTLKGFTTKFKPPILDHAIYLTINDIVLNEGTEHEKLYPYEIFINSKNMENFQWIVALTRTISAIFRKGGDATFLIEELGSVFDPHGGYRQKGGKFYPSIVAEIADILKQHFIEIGYMVAEEDNTSAMVQMLMEKGLSLSADSGINPEEIKGIKGARCSKCHQDSVVMLGGCMTCLNCGDSKCG